MADTLVKHGITKVIATPKYKELASSCTSAVDLANKYLREASL
ncbi:hypothetical protein P4574_18470 [Priestia megaterium]|nr:hypothetical protein [Priestia megaterium]MED3870977.1 hypothetical protein [Priestia megaterium]